MAIAGRDTAALFIIKTAVGADLKRVEANGTKAIAAKLVETFCEQPLSDPFSLKFRKQIEGIDASLVTEILKSGFAVIDEADNSLRTLA